MVKDLKTIKRDTITKPHLATRLLLVQEVIVGTFGFVTLLTIFQKAIKHVAHLVK